MNPADRQGRKAGLRPKVFCRWGDDFSYLNKITVQQHACLSTRAQQSLRHGRR
jgi:hypothetical protein